MPALFVVVVVIAVYQVAMHIRFSFILFAVLASCIGIVSNPFFDVENGFSANTLISH